MDKRVRFDSRSTKYRCPCGALEAGAHIKLRIEVSESVVALAVRAAVQYDDHGDIVRYAMCGTGLHESYNGYEVSIPLNDRGLYWYRFEIDTDLGYLTVGRGENNTVRVWDPNDGSDEDGIDPPASWQISVYHRDYDSPEWLYGGVIYQVFIDRFSRSSRWEKLKEAYGSGSGKVLREEWGDDPLYLPVEGKVLNNDFFGGDLQGIMEKLPYLRELGVSCIYLSPAFEAYSNHKYDTANYERIDPMFGDEGDFRSLCDAAAAMGIRIVLDGVFAHTGSDSVYFNRYKHYGEGGAYNDSTSEYRDWYCWREDGGYDSWWCFDTLPKTNKRCGSFRNYINGPDGIVRKWLRAGASGWRLDVVDEFPADFTAELCRAAKAEKDDAVIIGEVWEDASNKIAYDERKNYFAGDKLDSVMNYPFWDAIVAFVRNGCGAEALAETVEGICENYPPEVRNAMMNSLGTHDTPRIITALAGRELGEGASRDDQAAEKLSCRERERGRELVKVAAALQMTLPGVPSIYYGDETGLEGYRDPFNRRCYPWGKEDEELLASYRSLTGIRRSHGVYAKGEYRTLYASGGLYAFERYEQGGSLNGVVTAVNVGEADCRLTLGGRWRDLIGGGEYNDEISIGINEAVILERKR